jgi:hypothetical protein
MGEVRPPNTCTALLSVFIVLSGQRIASQRLEPVFKTTPNVGTEIHLAPGWNFGEAQVGRVWSPIYCAGHGKRPRTWDSVSRPCARGKRLDGKRAAGLRLQSGSEACNFAQYIRFI